MGGGGIYVTLIDHLKGYTESDAVSKLRRLIRERGKEYEEICGKNEDSYWYIDDKGIVGVDEVFDPIKTLHPRFFGLSFLEMKNKMLLVRENDRMISYEHKVKDSEIDRYFLFEDGKLVTKPEKIKNVIKKELKIEIPGMKLKHRDDHIAEFFTTPDY